MKKINYSKKRLNANLRMGLLFIGIGILLFTLSLLREEGSLFDLAAIGVGQVAVGVFSLGIHYYEKRKQYLTIDKGVLRTHTPFFRKEVRLEEVRRIRKFAGDYILKTDEKELTIHSAVMDKPAVSELEEELRQLDVEWK